MWGYYGSKSKVVGNYPAPLEDTIIEPFAGTAQYALKYHDKRVILYDSYELIIKLWKWLQSCSPCDIRGIRRLKYGENVDSFTWSCEEEKWLVGFIIVGAPSQPKKTASRWKTVIRPNTQNYKLNMIADNLSKIRHWEIRHGDYTDSPDMRATWFIDPPYTEGGQYYVKGRDGIDYAHLSQWSRKRVGQVIVCEKTGADWLPFRHLCESRGNRKTNSEAIWTNGK